MAPKKLSESEKKEIVQLYSKPEESTATLASRFGVSSSTISRILKQSLSDDDYNALVQQKRTGIPFMHSGSQDDDAEDQLASDDDSPQVMELFPEGQEEEQEEDDYPSYSPTPEPSSEASENGGIRRRRRRSRSTESEEEAIQLPLTEVPGVKANIVSQSDPWQESTDTVSDHAKTNAYASGYVDSDEDDEDDDALLDEDDLDDDLMDDDDEFDDDEDDDEDDDDLDPIQVKPLDLVEIFPFSTAELPRTCYLVIDRSAELITRPLQEFGELGNFPSAELMESTLPIFDNHRVAKRFANRRTQRIVKVPDSRILRKTTPYLQSKGITRLLIHGQVYSLTE
ncbi:MAG: helix-turn-helix domain-containing protein [Leptolyngbyaceae bacterium]|nr:helix-turn-helix domain-containing protein [Leptolyngbyaceae bacterium]